MNGQTSSGPVIWLSYLARYLVQLSGLNIVPACPSACKDNLIQDFPFIGSELAGQFPASSRQFHLRPCSLRLENGKDSPPVVGRHNNNNRTLP